MTLFKSIRKVKIPTRINKTASLERRRAMMISRDFLLDENLTMRDVDKW